MEAVYNNLIASYLYAGKGRSRNATVHGESSLRDHYNDIVSLSKKSPVYIIKLNENNQEYILDLKERSMSIMDEINSYYKNVDGYFNMKKAYSESGAVDAQIVSDDYDRLPEEFDIKVNQLAAPQINRGKEYYEDGRGLSPGSYSFTVNVNDHKYNLKYNVSKNKRNINIMNDIAKMINRADIGIQASVGRTKERKIFMEFKSEDSGNYGENIFSFSDEGIADSANGIVSYYGIDNVARKPKSLLFELDGSNKTSMSNEVILNKSLTLKIKRTSDSDIHIGYAADGTKAIQSVEKILEKYNSVIETDKRYREKTGEGTRLADEFRYIYERHEEELAGAGVFRNEDGYLVIDEKAANESFDNGEFQKVFSKESPFLNELEKKNKMISLNPLEYTNKIMVSYPDYSKEGFPQAYMTSMFSGMLFNYYC
ncbi:MAG: hypothetical protein HFH14_08305 [Lachnospiraceae bacterium]|nr:hypothetical protein [Lachnospiraceae bacterium]